MSDKPSMDVAGTVVRHAPLARELVRRGNCILVAEATLASSLDAEAPIGWGSVVPIEVDGISLD
ncbi:hypothetical protein [Methylobacterium dankookense]|uniref:hypothetical protein n=1 Tax=Methylobacterium dankookense TaxID=560405 RepID=UPI00119DC858|nr:hypothetical protein [Methylobacterium dankookense]